MSFQNDAEDDILKLIFQAVPWANFADNAASTPHTTFYVSAHTADPGEAGVQTTNEAAYSGYARVAVARTSGGWAVASGEADNVAEVTFPQSADGPETLTHFGVGTDASGAGKLIGSGALGADLVVNNGITPEFPIGDCNCSLD